MLFIFFPYLKNFKLILYSTTISNGLKSLYIAKRFTMQAEGRKVDPPQGRMIFLTDSVSQDALYQPFIYKGSIK